MINPLPNFDFTEEYTHAAFDELILEGIQVTTKLIVRGAHNYSDIKRNNMSGTLILEHFDNRQRALGNLFAVQIDGFTGNCGIKAIDHLYIRSPKIAKQALKIIESFLYHRTNCGLVIGSDTIQPHIGETLSFIRNYGENYEISKPVWNPNYTWAHNHRIALFQKDLTKTEHVSYW